MNNNHLNAGAASFTPGGSAPAAAEPIYQDDTETSFNEYGDSFNEFGVMLEDIEQEMDDDGPGSNYVPPPTAHSGGGVGVPNLPAHLLKHANEFWFPESRDCVCCAGFKHGCRCAAAHGGVCASCSTGSLPSPSSSLQAAAQAGPPPPQQQYQSSNARAPTPQEGQQICKFFRSPGGCRFGDMCRFSHG